jgi:hypothetical protein
MRNYPIAHTNYDLKSLDRLKDIISVSWGAAPNGITVFLVFSPFLYISLVLLGGYFLYRLFNINPILFFLAVPGSGWYMFYFFMGYLIFLFSSVVIIFGLVYIISSDATRSEP